VSPAGIALGDYLMRNVRADELDGRILDLGTGSGAMALLLRSMGARAVCATDISPSAVSSARLNELENFGHSSIDFQCGDLFPHVADGEDNRFDLIVFNPPGWRAPTDALKAQLSKKHHSLDLEAMFYGDTVVLRFLQDLPNHLTDTGRAIVGFNSLVGVADLTNRTPLHSYLRESIEFPLLFYTDEWFEVRHSLLSLFEQGRADYGATYVTRGDTIHWFYEIIEVTRYPSAIDVASDGWCA
jgi:release factor glutamine methyltransferase